MLEAPLILATGLGEAHDLAPSPRETMLVATERGLWEVWVDGRREKLTQQSVQCVTTLPEYVLLISSEVLSWGPYPEPGEPLQLAGRMPAPGVQSIQAWYESDVLLGSSDGIERLDLKTGKSQAIALMDGPVKGLGLGDHSEGQAALAQTSSGLYRVQAGEAWPLELPTPLHGAVLDQAERLWVAHGIDPQLSLSLGSDLRTVANNLSEPRGMVMGSGGLTPTDAIYIATAAGSLEYLRVPLQ